MKSAPTPQRALPRDHPDFERSREWLEWLHWAWLRWRAYRSRVLPRLIVAGQRELLRLNVAIRRRYAEGSRHSRRLHRQLSRVEDDLRRWSDEAARFQCDRTLFSHFAPPGYLFEHLDEIHEEDT